MPSRERIPHFAELVLDDIDQVLIGELLTDARLSVAELARRVRVARTTVQQRIGRLERAGVISGYTLKLGPQLGGRRISAHVQITVDPKRTDEIVKALTAIEEVRRLESVSGPYDMVALLGADSTAELDRALDRIGRISGIERTNSAIVLSVKLDRF